MVTNKSVCLQSYTVAVIFERAFQILYTVAEILKSRAYQRSYTVADIGNKGEHQYYEMCLVVFVYSAAIWNISFETSFRLL